MNLQQCRNIINFDLPWNPMRLVQRHGRIDRINSPFGEVYLRTFFPDQQLDSLLNLDERIRRKLAQAAASIGVETSPIETGPTGGQSFAETREEIEKLLKEDPALFERGGTRAASQTGEEYRQELRKALEKHGDKIKGLPWKAGSGFARGKTRGYFFCSSVGDRIYLRFLPFGRTIDDIISEIGTCLRMIECGPETPRELPMDLAEGIYDAWELVKSHIYNAWTYETDPINLQPKVRKLNRDVAVFIRKYPPSDIEDSRLHKCLDAIESPWSRREENQLREAFKQEYSNPHEHSKLIIDEVEKIGVEPFESPEPLPPIDPHEINLICWMIIEKI
jgi:hypothetical protein